MRDEAIIIKDLWGKILSGLVILGISGGVTFAFAQQSTNAELKTTVNNMAMVENQKGAQRDSRLDKLDAKIDTVQIGVSQIREQQARIDTKLDILLKQTDIKPSR